MPILNRKSEVFHLLEVSESRMHYLVDREEKKSPAPSEILTHNLSVMKRVLYHCATTAAQENKKILILS